MMKEMSIDLETYSDVNITKCGAYKYAESMTLPAATPFRKRSLQHYLMKM